MKATVQVDYHKTDKLLFIHLPENKEEAEKEIEHRLEVIYGSSLDGYEYEFIWDK